MSVSKHFIRFIILLLIFYIIVTHDHHGFYGISVS